MGLAGSGTFGGREGWGLAVGVGGPEVGAAVFGALQALLLAPGGDFGVVAGE